MKWYINLQLQAFLQFYNFHSEDIRLCVCVAMTTLNYANAHSEDGVVWSESPEGLMHIYLTISNTFFILFIGILAYCNQKWPESTAKC